MSSNMTSTGVITDDMINNASIVWGAVGIGSIISCLLILACSAYIYSIPQARHCLDRISYRLMLWATGMELINAVFWTVISISPSFSDYLYEYDAPTCAGSTYIIIATTGAINWLNACIGLNLALAIRYSLKKMHIHLEWWYVAISMFLGFFIPLVPAILGHFGPDPIYQDCWFTEGHPAKRVGWMLLDFYIWQMLSCIIGGGAVIMVLYTTIHHGRSTTRALLLDSTSTMKSSADMRLNHLQDKLLDIALRVAAYPIVLIVVNVCSMAEDFYFTFIPMETISQYAFNVIGTLVLCGRGIVFGLLVAFVDPSLRRAFGVVRDIKRNTTDTTPEDPNGESFHEIISAGAIDYDRRPSTQVLNIAHALRHLPFDSRSPPEVRSLAIPQKAQSTRSFPGVQVTSLPGNFTDDVDMDIASAEDVKPDKEIVLPGLDLPLELRRNPAEYAARRLSEIEPWL